MNNNQLLPLIVDFPIQPRANGFRNRVSIPQASVSFAPISEMKFIEFPSEPSSLFYTPEETRLFKILAARDIRLAAMMIGLDHVPEDEEEYWIGIEKYLSRDVAMRSVVRMRTHAHTIVSWQNECSVEELSSLSKASSRPARTLAYRLAAVSMGSGDIRAVLLESSSQP